MSRTYRCRHMPIHTGWHMTRKVVDGGGYEFRKRREYGEAEAEKILGPKPEYKFHWSDRYKHKKTPYDVWYWGWLAEQIADEWVVPVASWHSWQRHGPVGARKRYYRTRANRQARRATRHILQSQLIDDDWTGGFPSRNTFFNWWDIY